MCYYWGTSPISCRELRCKRVTYNSYDGDVFKFEYNTQRVIDIICGGKND